MDSIMKRKGQSPPIGRPKKALKGTPKKYSNFQVAKNFYVIGHRGNGMNTFESSDSRMNGYRENTIRSFNAAGEHGVDFVEFDVQVTKDKHPIIFHDDNICSTDENGLPEDKKVSQLSLLEFLQYGDQKDGSEGKKIMKKKDNGDIMNWAVEIDDCCCTLEEAFNMVKAEIGFNIELKFDLEEDINAAWEAVWKVVSAHAKSRPITFSTFNPEAALLVKNFPQNTYPMYFLTEGGNATYNDPRMDSLDGAIKMCKDGGLNVIVSDVRSILRDPEIVNTMKKDNLSLMTYGALNDVCEVVHFQYLIGVEGVIVDSVEEITQAVEEMKNGDKSMVQFKQKELEFLSNLIPHLMKSG